MSNTTFRPRGTSETRAWIWWAIPALLLLYPLSIGPVDIVYCRCERYSWLQLAIRTAYKPLGFSCEKSRVLNDALGSYIGLCHRIVGG